MLKIAGGGLIAILVLCSCAPPPREVVQWRTPTAAEKALREVVSEREGTYRYYLDQQRQAGVIQSYEPGDDTMFVSRARWREADRVVRRNLCTIALQLAPDSQAAVQAGVAVRDEHRKAVAVCSSTGVIEP